MKFIIFKKEQDGTYRERLSSYESEFKDDTSTNRSWLEAEPMASHFEVPLDADDEVLIPTLVEGLWLLAPDEVLVAQKALKAKEAAVALAYEAMNKDVLTQMALAFGTQNPDSASAYERTWTLMISSSAEWLGLGLKDDVGTLLETGEQVLAYAQAKLASVIAYGKFRLQRIEQFRAEKDAIVQS
jgi:hypothetical protein